MNKHHYEGTGRFKTTRDVKGFQVNAHRPAIAPPPSAPATKPPAVPRAAPVPKKR